MSSETSTNDGFHVSHFFVLLSLMAATVAVVMARPAAPEHLILISLTVGAAGLAALCFYKLLAPLVAPHVDLERQPLSDRLRLDLEREKALTLRSIKELEFDRAMSKVSAQDFEEMAGRLRVRAIGIMRQLDGRQSGYRSLIEKELQHRLDSTKGAARVNVAAAAAPVITKPVIPDGCACGTQNEADAKFCKSCGARLKATESEATK